MAQRRALSQESWKGSGEEKIPEVFKKLLAEGVKSGFLGYERLRSKAHIVALFVDGKEVSNVAPGTEAEVVLDQTPFYGEAGGQVGDAGLILDGATRFRVKNTLKFSQDLAVHMGSLESGTLVVAREVEAIVDEEKRQATARNHSATHLLHAALRETLGDHVKQAGSLVSNERLRFDFSHFKPLRPEDMAEIELMVNRQIRKNVPVETQVMSREEAMQTGAMAIFEERYGENVRVVSMGDGVSRELCGGTHIKRTGDIGLFRIVGEAGVAANVRRIEALTGEVALQHDLEQEKILKASASLLKTNAHQVTEKVKRLLEDLKDREKQIEQLKTRLITRKSEDFLAGVREIAGVKALALKMEAASPAELRDAADRIKDKLKSGIVVLGADREGKAMLTCMVTKDLMGRFKAGDIIRKLAVVVGGKGGGRPDMAQGGGNHPEDLEKAFARFYELLEETG
jgi:alanyl-tRNA synthetase